MTETGADFRFVPLSINHEGNYFAFTPASVNLLLRIHTYIFLFIIIIFLGARLWTSRKVDLDANKELVLRRFAISSATGVG